MEDELKSAAMHIITRFVWSAIRKNLKRRLLVVDDGNDERKKQPLFCMVWLRGVENIIWV